MNISLTRLYNGLQLGAKLSNETVLFLRVGYCYCVVRAVHVCVLADYRGVKTLLSFSPFILPFIQSYEVVAQFALVVCMLILGQLFRTHTNKPLGRI